MAVNFLGICLALYTVAVDAIHVQAGLHRHGAGDNTCPQVVEEAMIKTGFNMMKDLMPLKASQLGSILLQNVSMQNVSMIMKRNNQSHAVNVVTKAEKAQYYVCDTTDWQGIARRMMRIINFMCHDGTEMKQAIMTEWKMHPENVDPQVLAEIASWGFWETVTHEENAACRHFDPMNFMGFFGFDFGQMEGCLLSMYGLTDDCSGCAIDSMKDMIGEWPWEIAFSCAMKCQNQQDPACLGCSEPIMTNMGTCMAGEHYQTVVMNEVMNALTSLTNA